MSSNSSSEGVLFNILYVAPFYLSRTLRPSPDLNRDDPLVIRARARSVAVTCVVCSFVTYYVVAAYGQNDLSSTLRILGWWPISLLDISRILLLMVVWFAGPLFEAGIVEGQWRSWIKGRDALQFLRTAVGLRNIVIGPVTEELIWRSLIVPLHLLASHDYPVNIKQSTWSRSNLDGPLLDDASRDIYHYTKVVILTTPLYFGIAHVHHLYEYVLTHPRAPLSLAIVRTIVQFTFTTLFGWFEAYVFVRTGSLLGAIVAPSFCNWTGLPRFWGRVDAEAEDGAGVKWTVAYYLVLCAGALGFYELLGPLTESRNGLADF